MGRQLSVTSDDPLLIDLIEIQLMLQNEEQLLAPVAFQTAGNFLPTCQDASIGQSRKLVARDARVPVTVSS
jgi:hypothetical protein